ncbi:uncharacterized protein LOC143030303 [Oratosquilla oratoria]|uniref:uncharacterized protein LOC143030303 n=1 Tax=Oratosquilla oratoria TaxID=337810 RepID=UPI003F7587B0
MEDRKEEVQQQQEDKEEGKQQEGELEEKLWEVGEFLVTLVDNGRSVVARKDDLPLLPRSTKDFTPFLTELVLKNVSPLRKADPDLLQQGREWLTERQRAGASLHQESRLQTALSRCTDPLLSLPHFFSYLSSS